MKGRWLANLTWSEAAQWRDRDAVVVIPIGAGSKEHGHALPLCTDELLAKGLSEGVLSDLPVLVAPIVTFGYFPAFRHYPGSQHIRPETFSMLMEDLLDGFVGQGFRNIVILNTGVSTTPVLQVLVREYFERTSVSVPLANITALGQATDQLMQQALGGHGDEHETSIIMALAPHHVRMNRLVCDYGNLLNEPKTVFYRPTVFNPDPNSGIHHSATGIRGDATLATLEKGQAIVAASVEDVVSGIRVLFPDALAACADVALP